MRIRKMGISTGLAWLALLLSGCDDARPPADNQTSTMASEKQQVLYDSEACSKPANGKVYVQIGVDIYGFDQEWPIILGGPSRFPPLPGVQETEPEGCPGNPIRTSVVRFAFRYEALRDNKANPRPRMDMQGMGLLERASPDSEYSGWSLIKSNWAREKSQGECSNDGKFEVCGRVIRDRRHDLARVVNTVYSTPQGEDFLMDCSRFYGYAECTNAYELNSTSALYYKFQKKDKTYEDILNFDKELRQFLANSLCNDCLNNHKD